MKKYGLHQFKMNSEGRNSLKAEIDVYLKKFPGAGTKDVSKFLNTGEALFNLHDFICETLLF